MIHQSRTPLILRDPEILGGTPEFTGTRVPAQNLFDHLEAGDDIDAFLLAFPSIRREQVVEVLQLDEQAIAGVC